MNDLTPIDLEFWYRRSLARLHVNWTHVPKHYQEAVRSLLDETDSTRIASTTSTMYIRKVRGNLAATSIAWGDDIVLPLELVGLWVVGVLLNYPNKTILLNIAQTSIEMHVPIHDSVGNYISPRDLLKKEF